VPGTASFYPAIILGALATLSVVACTNAIAQTSSRTPAPGCAAAFTDTLSIRTLRAFDRVADVAPVWDDYSPARHPVLVLADSTHQGRPGSPICAAIWRNGKPLERFELPVRPTRSTPLYGMVSTVPVQPHVDIAQTGLRPVDPGVAAALRDRGITRVVFLNVPLNFSALGRLGEMLANGGADPVVIHADLAVHESFHLHAQFPTWLSQPATYTWPAWDVQPDRIQLRRCYDGSPELISAFNAEHQALIAAYDALFGATRDSIAALRHARRAVELRAARRVLQDTMRVSQGTERITCGRAEDLMELEEGSVQWIGHATTERAGLTTMATHRGPYAGSQPERFYQTGPLQWWILQGLLGRDAVHRMTTQLARAPGPDVRSGSVFALFDDHTRALSDGRH
jgi:hypothetical protein